MCRHSMALFQTLLSLLPLIVDTGLDFASLLRKLYLRSSVVMSFSFVSRNLFSQRGVKRLRDLNDEPKGCLRKRRGLHETNFNVQAAILTLLLVSL